MSSDNKQSVEQLRQNIDDCDSDLINIIAKRQGFVEQLVAFKKHSGDAIVDVDREDSIKRKLTERAQQHSVSEELIHDIFQRIVRDSYSRQADMEYACSSENPKRICVIGGQGKLGKIFAGQFARSGHIVRVIEQEEWPVDQRTLKDFDLVLIAVPIKVTEEIISHFDQLSDHCILADLTSIKSMPTSAMLNTHKGPIVAMHPMFGPGLEHLARQLILVNKARVSKEQNWLFKQFEIWGCKVVEIDVEEHDKVMSIVQALRHFTTFVAGWHLMKSNTNIKQLVAMSSPIYRLELALIGRLFAQDSGLYIDIMSHATHGEDVLSEYGELYQTSFRWLKEGKRDKLVETFEAVSDYFSDWTKTFKDDSDKILSAWRERG